MEETPRSEFRDRAEELNRQLADTSDFAHRRWQALDEELRLRRLLREERLRGEVPSSLTRWMRLIWSMGLTRWIALPIIVLSLVGIVSLVLRDEWNVSPIISSTLALVAAGAALLVRGSHHHETRPRLQLPERLVPLMLALARVEKPFPRSILPDLIAHSPEAVSLLLDDAHRNGLIEVRGEQLALTLAGRAATRELQARLEISETISVKGTTSDPDPETEPPTAAGV